MRLGADECRSRLLREPVLHLATCGSDRQPHLVPVTYAAELAGGAHAADVLCVAVDHKPKTTTALRRLRNIRENPRVCFLADHYDDDWSRLWWVRADAVARVIDDGVEHDRAVDLLRGRYRQYRADPLSGPVIRAEVVSWSGWQSASDGLRPTPRNTSGADRRPSTGAGAVPL